VTSLTTYAAIAREIVATAASQFDRRRRRIPITCSEPSFVPLLADADVFVTTGLDLELWVPAPARQGRQTRA